MDDAMNAFAHDPHSRTHHQHFSACLSDSGLHYLEKPRFSVAVKTQNSVSKLAVPFKSHFCLLYQKGGCYYGEQCRFAHDISEIRNPISSGLGTANGCRSGNRISYVGKIAKCRWFASGRICPYGDGCQFLHKCDRVEYEGLLSTDDVYKRGIFQKMKLCNTWEKFGYCRYGVKCIFAHGNSELKSMSSHAVVPVYGCTSKLKLQTSPCKAAAATSKITFETAHKVLPEGMRRFTEWSIERMNHVYADWMDSTNSLTVFEQSWEINSSL